MFVNPRLSQQCSGPHCILCCQVCHSQQQCVNEDKPRRNKLLERRHKKVTLLSENAETIPHSRRLQQQDSFLAWYLEQLKSLQCVSESWTAKIIAAQYVSESYISLDIADTIIQTLISFWMNAALKTRHCSDRIVTNFFISKCRHWDKTARTITFLL